MQANDYHELPEAFREPVGRAELELQLRWLEAQYHKLKEAWANQPMRDFRAGYLAGIDAAITALTNLLAEELSQEPDRRLDDEKSS